MEDVLDVYRFSLASRNSSLAGMPVERARVVLTLVDGRTRVGSEGRSLVERLREELRVRGWPLYETFLSRSPRVEALNSGGGVPLSILHHARGTRVHAQLHDLALEVLRDLEGGARPQSEPAPPDTPGAARKVRRSLEDIAADLMGGWRGR